MAIFAEMEVPVWLRLSLAPICFLGAFGQLWQWGLLSINARRAAIVASPREWALLRTAYVAKSDAVNEVLSPGWLFIYADRVDVFSVRTTLSTRSNARLAHSFSSSQIERVSIGRRSRVTFNHILLVLDDGREVEIEITPKDGWAVRGARRSELEEIVNAMPHSK
ncbi:hypothetical protein [Microbacterium capsulatum]|uniref:PH domain-containing protein n=1 Tax=Microbacterium capsulatum TaxID=3041921 RepID=A0ABU0XJC5_9MICO|nr:hypothetical protein [Microbacterium sp. ASV81]MDQ4215246.1 hypothetical protein [Microbacterium sp. ASV81]